MHAFILQEWTTIRGGVSTITQGEDGWLDLSPYQDLVFWLDVREVTGTVSINFQTAPAKDEILWTNIITNVLVTTGGNPTIKSALMTGGLTTVPVARFLRWQLYSTTALWDATLRILVAANSPGM